MSYTPARHCFRCGSPWYGYGNICNACKTIETLEKQASSTASVSKPSYDSKDGYNAEARLEEIVREGRMVYLDIENLPEQIRDKIKADNAEAARLQEIEDHKRNIKILIEIFIGLVLLYLLYISPVGKFFRFIYYIAFGWWIELFIS